MEETKPEIHPEERQALIDNLKSANSTILQRVLFILSFVLISWALIAHVISNNNLYQENYQATLTLEKILETDSVEKYVEENDFDLEDKLFFLVDWDMIMYELKKGNYQNTEPVRKAISELNNKMRTLASKTENQFQILGVIISGTVWGVLIPIILFFAFHETVQMIAYRRIIINKCKQAGISEWKSGPTLIGFSLGYSSNLFSGHYRFLSHFIVWIFFTLPLVTAFLFTATEMQGFRVDNGFYYPVLIIKIACFIFITLEYCKVMYDENILGFQFIVKGFLGKDFGTAQFKMRDLNGYLWVLIPFLQTILQAAAVSNYEEVFFTDKAIFVSSVLFSTSLFTIGLFFMRRNKERIISQAVTFAGIVANFFWILLIIFFLTSGIPLSHNSFEEIPVAVIPVTIGGFIFYLLMSKVARAFEINL